MRASEKRVTRWGVIAFAPLAACLVSTSARADEPGGTDVPPPADTKTTLPEPPTATPDAGAPAADAGKVIGNAGGSASPLGSIERLPSSAFPSEPVRGLAGGSLWSTFHGQQWPYYPKTGIGVSGYAWIDTGYEHIARRDPAEQGIKYLLQQGRFLLRVTPTWSDGKYFVQGQAEMVAEKDQSQAQPFTADADDVWIKAGQWKAWDVQVGRYEAWEVYHFGMGMDLYTLERNGATDTVYSVPSIYGLTYAFYRPAGIGAGALHLYPTKNLRFELGTQFGNEFGSNGLAARPVGVFDLGWLKLKAGAEYKKLTDQTDGSQGETTSQGVGGAIQFVLDPYVEFGASGAYGLVDSVSPGGQKSQTGSYTNYSVGGFANVRLVEDLLLGAGYNYTYLEDKHPDPSDGGRNDKFSHTQTFVAVQYLIAKQLYVKVVGAYALGQFDPNFMGPIFQNEMFSGRIRLQYLF